MDYFIDDLENLIKIKNPRLSIISRCPILSLGYITSLQHPVIVGRDVYDRKSGVMDIIEGMFWNGKTFLNSNQYLVGKLL